MGVDIEIKLYANLRDVVGATTVQQRYPEGTTVRGVLESLVEDYPALDEYVYDEDGAVRSTLVVRRNRDVADLHATVQSNDHLAITTQIVGGRS